MFFLIFVKKFTVYYGIYGIGILNRDTLVWDFTQSNEWQALDILDRIVLYDLLASYGITSNIIILRSLYQRAKCRVIHRGQLGSELQVAPGVKKGYILSPLLWQTFFN